MLVQEVMNATGVLMMAWAEQQIEAQTAQVQLDSGLLWLSILVGYWIY
jgi:hypothetical protein